MRPSCPALPLAKICPPRLLFNVPPADFVSELRIDFSIGSCAVLPTAATRKSVSRNRKPTLHVRHVAEQLRPPAMWRLRPPAPGENRQARDRISVLLNHDNDLRRVGNRPCLWRLDQCAQSSFHPVPAWQQKPRIGGRYWLVLAA